MKILLVGPAEDNLATLQQLRPFWENHEPVWVTFSNALSQEILQGATVYWAWGPTHRNLLNLLRNTWLALRVLWQEHPALVIATGSGAVVPFVILARLGGSQTVFIESLTRVKQLSLSGRLVLPFLSVLYVHWSQLQARYPKAELIEQLQLEDGQMWEEV